ncbi:LamG domain-containing protein [Pedobacter nutrimenti]|uniref:3-keto-disaccharide hydrolase domain-containing protein n=1 Tax=Pedobacter nutrimenti TaxID=1241337 RepID=A0A318UK38_9SPHI|nr:hypothetical protein [Pedobacter nutrimenti]PYF76752.1 hypothetical protein B0O44_101224 [Pedobacter nutrimenti]
MKKSKFSVALKTSLIPCCTVMFALFTLFILPAHGQDNGKKIVVNFDARYFDTTQRKADFLTYKGFKAMKISKSPGRQTIPVGLKGITFQDGTIEFDAIPPSDNYNDGIAINFHQKDPFNFETVYLRLEPDETSQRDDAIQYTPYIHGVNLWDMMKPFRGYATIHNKEWNHIKLVISGLQMMVYVNDFKKPALKVSRLEGNDPTGGISFDGEAYFANLVIKPGATEQLSPLEGPDWTDNDPSYMRKWMVTAPKTLEKGRELTAEDLPSEATPWQPIDAERRGLINLIRRFKGELTSYPKERRYVWLKTTIRSLKQQHVGMQLGFNKEVYVFLNKRLIYIDKNSAEERLQKYPGGLLDIGNTEFDLPLKEGDNEVLIGIAAKNYGWGIMARIKSLDYLFIQR